MKILWNVRFLNSKMYSYFKGIGIQITNFERAAPLWRSDIKCISRHELRKEFLRKAINLLRKIVRHFDIEQICGLKLIFKCWDSAVRISI